MPLQTLPNAPAPDALGSESVEARSVWRDARHRLYRNKAAMASLVVLGLIVVLAAFGPSFSPHAYDDVFWDRIQMPPDFEAQFWFGTDGNGRDLFVRTLYGARVSLAVGLIATSVSMLIGVVYGPPPGTSAGASTR